MRINYHLTRPAYGHLHRPTKAHPDDAGVDLRAAVAGVLEPGEIRPVPTGIRLDLPRGWEGQIRPRSGLAATGITIANAPGTIDAGYTGEIRILLENRSSVPRSWHKGDRLAQLVIKEVPHVVLVDATDSEDQDPGAPAGDGDAAPGAVSGAPRGASGFGSTGIR